MTGDSILVPIADGMLACRVVGDGPPVLLVHAYPLSSQIWRRQIADLADTHCVIAPDLFGFGESGVPAGGASRPMAAYADDLATVLDHLDVDRPIVYVGVSMAGYIGWQFATRHRDRLGRMALACTKAAADTSEFAAKREQAAEKVLARGVDALRGTPRSLLGETTRSERPEIESEIAAIITQTDPRGVAAAQRGMAVREDFIGRLPSIDFPMLLIAGQEDTFSPPEEMQAWAETIPGARFEVIARSGHLPMVEQPTAFGQLLRDFLAADDASAPP